jgi:hemoglobin
VGVSPFAAAGRYDRRVETRTLYDAAGGMRFFEDLVGRFYDNVAADPVLRAVYPDNDLSSARHRLTLFLAQYWGGPTTYGEERGHPRLRMRHNPFAIGPVERDAWLKHMREAIAWADPPSDVATRLHAYFDMAAEAMRNRE